MTTQLPSPHVRLRRTTAAAALFAWFAIWFALSASAATTITGTVTNGTTNKPAAGDDVVLVALQQRMQEIARAKTDAQGRYSLDAPDPGMHLIRVDHQKAAYFQPAPPNTSVVDVQVYDVAPQVPGVTTEANVMRVETDQQGLHVTQSYFIKNASSPPRTQFSNRSYEIYLPAGAKIEGSAAMGPGGMPVQSSPFPLGDPGHYTLLFPLRPGETQFQLSYHLPYSGSLNVTPHLATPVDNLVVMLPKSMTFKPSASASFQALNEDINAQTFLVKNATPAEPLAFTLSGSGTMPRDTQTDQGQGGGAPAAGGANSAASDTRPGGGLGTPIDTPDPLNKYKWWILGGIALALAIAAGFLLRKPADGGSVASPAAAGGSADSSGPQQRPSLLAALKDELFALETDRLQGKVSETEYVELKSALERILQRALTRQPA